MTLPYDYTRCMGHDPIVFGDLCKKRDGCARYAHNNDDSAAYRIQIAISACDGNQPDPFNSFIKINKLEKPQ